MFNNLKMWYQESKKEFWQYNMIWLGCWLIVTSIFSIVQDDTFYQSIARYVFVFIVMLIIRIPLVFFDISEYKKGRNK